MQNFGKALDIDSNCFLFASAGSGKTKTLVDRYIKSLCCGITSKEILCLTFTNNAVFEMQTRISNILKKLLLNENNFAQSYITKQLNLDLDDTKIINLSKKLYFEFQNSLNNLKILTIHSFCEIILKKYPLEVDLSPNFKILDEKDSFATLNEAKNNVLKNLLNSKDEKLLENLIELLSASKFEELIKSIYSDYSKFLEFFLRYPDINHYQDILEKKFNFSEKISFSKEQIDFISENFQNQNLEDIFLTKSGELRKKLSGKDKTTKEISEIVFQNSQNSKKELVIKKTISFLRIAQLIIEEFKRLKSLKNALDFSDVLIKTKELLTTSYAKDFVLSKICSELKCIMIDEAQDLSNIQWELISIFCEDIFSLGNNKTIFAVGDIKQSIYRFQNANHKLFLEFYNHCKKNFSLLSKPCETIFLNKSFRSLAPILEFTDKVFANNSVLAFNQKAEDYKKHIAHREALGGKVEIIEETDINKISEFIQNIISSKTILPSTQARIKPGDILILSRSRNNLYNGLMQKLSDKQIKIAPPDKIPLMNNLLILDIIALAKTCLDPINSEYSLACILKSPYIFSHPMSNNEIFKICHNRTDSIFELLKKADQRKANKINNFIEHFNKNKLLDFFYYVSRNITKYNRNDDFILTSFMNEVINFSKTKSNNIMDFLDYFKQKEPEVSSQLSNNEELKFSTIHGAKGLESPIVILLDFNLTADKSKLNSIWYYSEEIFEKNKKNSTLHFIKPRSTDHFAEAKFFIENEYKEEESELYRLLYVALTRAKDYLYIIGQDNGKNVTNLIKKL